MNAPTRSRTARDPRRPRPARSLTAAAILGGLLALGALSLYACDAAAPTGPDPARAGHRALSGKSSEKLARPAADSLGDAADVHAGHAHPTPDGAGPRALSGKSSDKGAVRADTAGSDGDPLGDPTPTTTSPSGAAYD